MTHSSRQLFTAFAIIVAPIVSMAQITGQVNYDKLGISFTIPTGWAGQESGDVLVMGSNSIAGMLLMTSHAYTKQELIQEAKAGIDEGNGTQFFLSGALDVADRYVAGTFTGTAEWSPAKAYIMGVPNPYGGPGVTIMAMTTPEAFSSAHKKACMDIYQSLSFKKVDRSSELQEWKDWLGDSRLTYMDSYSSSSYGSGGLSGGYSSQRKIDLCAKGYFSDYSYNDMSISGTNASGYNYSNDSGSGTWDIKMGSSGDFLLILKYSNGEISEYTMQYEDSKFYLNGNRYFVTSEGEYAPNCR